MQLECVIHRDGGTLVSVDETDYWFVPGADGRHLSEVSNPDHITRLLAIPEAYRAVEEYVAPVRRGRPPKAAVDFGLDEEN